ncbi:hypothetical protein [Microbacterium paludicola]|uniref:hypothetical protein n=1 Tax=Microbacterium paludicola TaxID=300019 RepID=UPI0031D3579D
MRVSPRVHPAASSRKARAALTFGAALALVLSLVPIQAAVAEDQEEVTPPPVATVPLERDETLPGADTLPEADKAGDVTLDVADPGNTPYPGSGASPGSVDGASGSRFELVRSAQSIVRAAPVVGFTAGNIVSDGVFTNKATMSEASIRSFIDGKVAACQSGYTCLEQFKQTTPTRAADAYCSRYTGASSETAARIIYKVAQACGINPQVLLVMLQKEQGLITHTWPSDWRFTIAMGMGCPDTADCDKTYYGFFNQVYGAARQMKIYGKSSYFTWYAPGGTRSIGYHPNASCGSSGVYVQNQSTANLYYYTPYQPNAAALAAGFGTGDSCSSYGNRNFYNYFRAWFGSTGGGTAAVKADPKNSRQIYRFWSPKFDNAHFYTASTAEAQALKSNDPNWRYEGTDFRVWSTVNGLCPTGSTAVYRFWSSKFASHFYTTNAAEAERVRTSDPNWRFEGTGFCSSTSSKGTVPVHRFWSSKFKKHFYTANATEAQKIRSGDRNWTYEGVAMYAPSSGPKSPALR